MCSVLHQLYTRRYKYIYSQQKCFCGKYDTRKKIDIALFPLWSLWNKIKVLNLIGGKIAILKHGNVIRAIFLFVL